MTLHLGGKEIQILHVGRAHTRGDSIIFVPQDRIVYLSELYFADQFLFINDGYGLDWLAPLDAVQALDADIFVPGHGPDSGRSAGDAAGTCAFPADARRRARRRAEGNRARRDRRSGGRHGPMAAV